LSCRLVDGNGTAGLSVKLSDRLSFPVPESRVARYRPHAGRELLFGLRPEDIIEKRGDLPPGRAAFDAQLDVVEPMGMETMVYFVVEGTEVCGRVNPAAAGKAGEMMPHVADPGSAEAMVEAGVRAFGRVDALINNAALYGALHGGRFDAIDEAEWDAAMAVNVKGIWNCCKAAVPAMRRAGGGSIVNIAS